MFHVEQRQSWTKVAIHACGESRKARLYALKQVRLAEAERKRWEQWQRMLRKG